MTSAIHDAKFWDASADYRTTVHDFTQFYSRCAWDLAQVPPCAHVLDVACGGGALTQFAAEAGHKVLATDFSQGMVDAVAARGWPGVTARVMDGQALDLPDARFDAAFSIFGIMLFPDWNAGLAELVRVLRPGGIACIGTWKEPGGAAVNLLVDQMSKEHFPDLAIPSAVPGMVEWTDRTRFEAALSGAGLGQLAFHEVTSTFVLDQTMMATPERVFQFSPIWPELSENQQAEMLAAMHEQMQAGDGTIAIPSSAVVALGRKG
jgi:ubiquinone/menaquinone biosynthesis C-methylase UbiE